MNTQEQQQKTGKGISPDLRATVSYLSFHSLTVATVHPDAVLNTQGSVVIASSGSDSLMLPMTTLPHVNLGDI